MTDSELDECRVKKVNKNIPMKNRAIKFRAWDGSKILNPVIPIGDDQVIIGFIHPMMNVILPQGREITALIPHEPIISIMQFTGLLDKNGKEIFEGDICQQPYLCDVTEIGVIEYLNGQFAFLSKEDPTEKVVGWSLIDASNIEVIGNIYENPELLK